MKTFRSITAFFLLASAFTACKKDSRDEPEPAKPAVEDLEIGLGNNEIGIIGKDFHFNANVSAADKIETVQVKIVQRSGETYSRTWNHEVLWEQYKGAKNTTIHKHFDIPADAVEGKYDFLIIVNDQNGTRLEIKKNFAIYAEANVPVNPTLSLFNVFVNEARFYRNGNFTSQGSRLKKGDLFNSQATIAGAKGSGKMYLLLISKKANHRPESIDKIDFSKVIVYDVYEHRDWTSTDFFSNSVFDLSTNTSIRSWPNLNIGAANDNNLPQPNPINGSKAWESGLYYFGVLYKNSTYNMGYYHYIEIPVEIN